MSRGGGHRDRAVAFADTSASSWQSSGEYGPKFTRQPHIRSSGPPVLYVLRHLSSMSGNWTLVPETVQIVPRIFRDHGHPRPVVRVGHDAIPLRVSLARACSG